MIMYDGDMTETRELVGVAEISARFGVGRTTVSQWQARRASTGFPDPVADLRMGPVFDWDEVRTWHTRWRG